MTIYIFEDEQLGDIFGFIYDGKLFIGVKVSDDSMLGPDGNLYSIRSDCEVLSLGHIANEGIFSQEVKDMVIKSIADESQWTSLKENGWEVGCIQ